MDDQIKALRAISEEGYSFAARAADTIATLTAERDAAIARAEAAEADNANLRTVMIAAAEEIHEHWDAHCDAEGYGPANLMRRLEDGIPAQYGYTAGAWAALCKRVEAAEADVRRVQWLEDKSTAMDKTSAPGDRVCVWWFDRKFTNAGDRYRYGRTLRAAIDAAIDAQEQGR